MYRSFFKLREDPFANCPDPRFFYNSPEHEEALASLQHVATHRKGAILLTGAPGVGKTLVGRLAFRGLGSNVRVAWLRNPQLSARELLLEICRGLHLDVDNQSSQVDMMSLLERYLISQFSNDTVVCLVVDEVQDFSCEAVRLLKTLNNLEVDDAKLIQLILLGRPTVTSQTVARLYDDFQERLYRILELPPLDLQQTGAYISQRLTLAGNDGEVSFTSEAVARIHEVSEGIPRAINKIAEFALLTAFARSAHMIGAEIVDHAIEENQLNASRLMEPPPDADSHSNAMPEPLAQPAGASGRMPLAEEIRHVHRIARGLRARRQHLQDAVTIAEATLEHLQDANANSHQNLSRLEKTLEQTRLVTEAARTAEMDVRAELDHTESRLRDRADTVSAQVEDLIGKLHARLEDFDRLQERAQRAVADARDQIALLEQADRHSAGLAANIEELHGRARGAGDLYRSLQARLDATQDRIDHTSATAADQIARLSEYQANLDDRLDRARNAITTLGKVGATELRLNELLQTARGVESGLEEANRTAQQTLMESEDHVGDLTEALDQSRQHLKDAKLILTSAQDERKASEATQRNTRELLKALTQRKALLDESMAQADRNVGAVQQAQVQLEDLLTNGRTTVENLKHTCTESVQAAETTLAQARKRCETAASEAHTRIATAREELADAAAETQAKIECLVDQTSRQCNNLLTQSGKRLASLESANADAVQRADSLHRLIRQLDETRELGLIQHRDAQRAHADLCAQTARAQDALGRLDTQLPRVEEAHKHTEELLLRVDRKVDELQQSFQQGDALLAKAAHFLADFRNWKQELQRDRTQAAKVLRRARKHIATVLEAEARARGIVHITDEKTAKFDATLLRADRLLCDTANKLNRMHEAHDKTERLLDRGLKQLSEHQVRADAILAALEEKRLAAAGALERLGQSTRAALQINKIQGRARDDLRRGVKRVASRAYAEREAAEEALRELRDATRQAVEAIAQPRAVLEEAMQRVPQLQKLCKTLHEIYFKLNTHVPEVVTPGDWEKMCDTAEGATRQLLIANTARIRQLVDVTRRLFEKTAERMAHLQSENERASTLCRLLPRRVQESATHLAETKIEPQRRMRTCIAHAPDISGSARSQEPAQPANPISRIEGDLTELSRQDDSAKVAALAKRVAGLAEIIQTGSNMAKPSPGTNLSSPPSGREPAVESTERA